MLIFIHTHLMNMITVNPAFFARSEAQTSFVKEVINDKFPAELIVIIPFGQLPIES